MRYDSEAMKELLAGQAPNLLFIVCMIVLSVIMSGLHHT